MFLSGIFLSFVATITATTLFKNPHYWIDRDIMVHLFEWKWNDIADECERFLAPKGFGGVQISPPNENLVIDTRPWWERYQPVSYKLITRSGDEAAFRNMVKRCNDVGVRIYADTVINHMNAVAPLPAYGTGGSSEFFDLRSWPAVPYNSKNFHSPECLITNYQNATEVRNCYLNGLADLDQGTEDTRSKIAAYMNNLIDIGVAGFRIDAAKHMWPNDLKNIYNRLNNLNRKHGFSENSHPFIYQEVIDYGGEPISALEYVDLGRVIEFKYGAGLSKAFDGNNTLKWLLNWGGNFNLLNSNDSFIFIDNHDTQRGDSVLTYKNPKPYKMAIAFMIAQPYGVPQIISSFAFDNAGAGPPADVKGNLISPIIYRNNTCGNGYICEHRWPQIYNMIGFRNAVKGTEIKNWWDNGSNKIAFCRGNLGFIAFNLDNSDLKETLQTCLPAGVYCDVISGGLEHDRCTGKTVTVNRNGTAYIEILTSEDDGILAIHHNARINISKDESEKCIKRSKEECN